MLLVKSKYKIAKRLGAGVFEKTQSQKFALSAERSPKKQSRGGGRGKSDFGRQLLEKQKIRFTYGLSERQLSNYAHTAFEAKDPSAALHEALETRADSAVYRAGLASTHRAARQMVSHGHILVNGTRITTPSYKVKVGDSLTVREGSRSSPLFAVLSEENDQARRAVPKWINFDVSLLQAKIVSMPAYASEEIGLDYPTLFEFYSR